MTKLADLKLDGQALLEEIKAASGRSSSHGNRDRARYAEFLAAAE